MKFIFTIARRYLLAKKSHNAINIISGISVAGVCIVAMALVVVLSVFNGFENLVVSLYNSFDPHIKISPARGKTFDLADFPSDAVLKIKGIKHFTETIDENALLKYREKQHIATIKGVRNVFLEMTGLDSMVVEGKAVLKEDGINFGIMGIGVAYHLSAGTGDLINPIEIFVPRRGASGNSVNPAEAFNKRNIYLSSVFSIQQDFDLKYLVVPIDFARELLDYDTEVSTIEIEIAADADLSAIKSELKQLLGDGYEVKDRLEQHEFLYKILKSEKLAVFLILSFILIIAIFNVVGSLTMLILDKKKDIGTLRSLGADVGMIRKIFIVEGLLIILTGAVSGIVLGVLICMAQIHFGIIRLQGTGSFVVDYYPVQMQAPDFIYVFCTVMTIGMLAVWFPVRQIIRQNVALRYDGE